MRIKRERRWASSVGGYSKALSSVMVRSGELSWDELQAAYKRVADDFLPVKSKYLEVETQRRVAERLLLTAIQKSVDWKTCAELFVELERLGYADLPTKGRMYVAVATYCLTNEGFSGRSSWTSA